MRKATEGFFASWDSTELFYRTWAPQDPSSKKAIIVIHRGHEHSGRVQDVVDSLDLKDFWAFAYDGRGHGQSPGPRGYAPDFNYLVKDLDFFVRLVTEKHQIPIENVVVVANSVGAVIASTWVHDYAPRIRSMVLAAPALRVKLYVPFALPGLRLLDKIKHPAFISSYVKSRMLTHDVVEAQRYNEDKLITRDIAVNILIGLFDAATRLLEDAQAIRTPTLILSAGKDFVVDLSAQRRFFESLGSPVKKMHVFRDFYHGVLYEKGRDAAFAIARDFVLDSFKIPVSMSHLLNAHKKSVSYERYMALQQPAEGVKAKVFGFMSATMQTVGRLSQGVEIGLQTGFDSGLSLDYVYENKPRGRFILGRLIDYFYLNAVGWRGIRLRKINIEAMLEEAILKLHRAGQPIRILDIAGGPGRYLIELASRHRDKNIQVQIRDNVQGNLKKGRQIAVDMGMHNVQHILVDAFAENDIASFHPNIVVVSGFFELISDNDLIMKALKSVVKEATPDAIFVYTGQPWHPQQEFIARTLTNREGKAWIMRLRSQAELDEIFRTAGVEKERMDIDSFGIFTVSVGHKRLEESVAQVDISPATAPEIASL